MDNYYKYLPVSEEEQNWGLWVLSAGAARVEGTGNYPLTNHPSHHYFNWNKGRVLHEYQIIYITKGEGCFESRSCGQLAIKSGSIIILFPGEWHRYKPSRSTGWDEYWIGISGNIIDNLLQKKFFRPENPVISVGFNVDLFNLLTGIIDKTKEEKSGFQALVSGSAFHLLGHLYSIGKASHLEDEFSKEIINKAKILFRANIGADFSTEHAAEELQVGYSWFRKAFKAHTGMAPGQYFIQLKVQKAKELLSNPQHSIKCIAYDLKFDSTFYFSKLFKEKTGFTPIQFRKQLLKFEHAESKMNLTTETISLIK